MRGPKLSDYDGDKQAYESAHCLFEADRDNERRENYKPKRSMDIERFMISAEQAIQRLSDQMEDFAGRSRLKYDMVTVGIYQGKIDLLKSLGVMPHRVAQLQERVDEIRDEVKSSGGKEAA